MADPKRCLNLYDLSGLQCYFRLHAASQLFCTQCNSCVCWSDAYTFRRARDLQDQLPSVLWWTSAPNCGIESCAGDSWWQMMTSFTVGCEGVGVGL